jgi:L-ornithine N5-oxygenase
LATPKVSLATLESLYLARYTQQIAEQDASKWRFQMRFLSEVVEVKQEQDKVRLVTRNPRTGEVSMSAQTFDVVIAATGYGFAVNGQLIAPMTSILDGGALAVDREYRINFRRETVASDCGVWMLGSLSDVQQRGDDFSFMAERSRRVTQSVLKQMASDAGNTEQRYEQAVL